MAKTKKASVAAKHRTMKRSASRPRSPRQNANAISSRKKYRHNYLSKVIARVDFSPTLSLSVDNPPQGIPSAIKSRFPLSELQVLAHPKVQITSGGQSAEAKFTIERQHHWQFHSKKRDRYFEVSVDSLLIEYKAYHSFEGLLEDFLPVVEHFLAPVVGLSIHRIGLRYVDTISLSEPRPTVWEKYLKPDLLCVFRLADDPKTISRVFNILEFHYSDDTKLRFQYGMPNPDYPAPIKKKQFVLDWDAFAEGVALDHTDIERHLIQFHDKINSAFEEVITDALRDKMGVSNA